MARWHEVEIQENQIRLRLKGDWRLSFLPEIADELKTSQIPTQGSYTIDGAALKGIDTASAQHLLLWLFRKIPHVLHSEISWTGFQDAQKQLLELVLPNALKLARDGHLRSQEDGLITALGRTTVEISLYIANLMSFLGATLWELFWAIFHPKQFRVRELFVQLEYTGINAIPIIALVNFLIGIVIAYLFGIQIQKYGANIFIVDGCSLAICRELSPILAAIIVAGRSGSAFTAQLGAMKINEEVDALSVLGLSPFRVLVLPRVLALMLVLPLLVFVGDVVGILGSMLIADLKLDVTGITFINRLQLILPVRSLVVGLVKAPFFAFFIGIIGCHMGLSVEPNARSLGLGTTATVVRSIVAVILLNAGFAVLFSELKI